MCFVELLLSDVKDFVRPVLNWECDVVESEELVESCKVFSKEMEAI